MKNKQHCSSGENIAVRACHNRNSLSFCHPERSEGSRLHLLYVLEILRFALNDIAFLIVVLHYDTRPTVVFFGGGKSGADGAKNKLTN